MIKFAFLVMTTFWILSPILFTLGWILGVWRTPYDWFIGLALSGVSTFVICLNYDPKKDDNNDTF